MRPAMKPTTGLGWARVLLYFSKYSAASSSIEPPISPMMTMPASGVKPSVIAESAKQLTLRLGIFQEELHDVDVLRTRVRVTSNADAQ